MLALLYLFENPGFDDRTAGYQCCVDDRVVDCIVEISIGIDVAVSKEGHSLGFAILQIISIEISSHRQFLLCLLYDSTAFGNILPISSSCVSTISMHRISMTSTSGHEFFHAK